MSFDERYRAIHARDTRFDGQFVTAVRTTGIYCRPSCPARTPKPTNVEFFATSAAAHESGYRACKRCLPEAAPGSPAWDIRGDVAGRAMRLIADGVIEREGVAGLAARLGYSTRHLTRMLSAELGAGPLALARAQRAHTARMLLVHTDLPMTDVAFSAGFASVRQFNDTVREVFGLSPTALRARAPIGHCSPADPHEAGVGTGRITLALPVRGPFDDDGLYTWMIARALPGMETADATSFTRTLQLPGGPAWFRISNGSARDGARDEHAQKRGALRLDARLSRLSDLAVLVARARRLFDLDADPVAIDAALSTHAPLAPLVAAVPGIRVPGTADPHEMLIRAMIGQQVSVASARTALTRLVAELGQDMPADLAPIAEQDAAATGPEPDAAPARPREHRLFPTMAAIAEHGDRVLRGPAARIRAITGTAAALASGGLTLTSGDDAAEQRERLLAMPGIGPWTADYVRMRVTGDPDVFLPGDVAVRTGAARAGLPEPIRELTAWAAGTAPWRSYLTAHLWRASATAPSLVSPRTKETPA